MRTIEYMILGNAQIANFVVERKFLCYGNGDKRADELSSWGDSMKEHFICLHIPKLPAVVDRATGQL